MGVGADLGCGGGGDDDDGGGDDDDGVGGWHAGERVASAAANGCDCGAGCEVSGECRVRQSAVSIALSSCWRMHDSSSSQLIPFVRYRWLSWISSHSKSGDMGIMCWKREAAGTPPADVEIPVGTRERTLPRVTTASD